MDYPDAKRKTYQRCSLVCVSNLGFLSNQCNSRHSRRAMRARCSITQRLFWEIRSASKITPMVNGHAFSQRRGNLTSEADFALVVEHLHGSLFRFAVSLTRSESDASDLVQQTFLILATRSHRI